MQLLTETATVEAVEKRDEISESSRWM